MSADPVVLLEYLDALRREVERMDSLTRSRDGWRRRAVELGERLYKMEADRLKEVLPSRLDLGLVKKGDLIDVTYGSYRTTHEVENVERGLGEVRVVFKTHAEAIERKPEEYDADYRWSERP